MKITKRQLRRIIKEEKARLLAESRVSFDYTSAYSALEDLFMASLPADIDFVTAGEFSELEQVLRAALRDLKDRVVGDPRGLS
tara:strand:- start:43 stop:291 length:249 start_codon:yes stop_codon:yes gene_type:complete